MTAIKQRSQAAELADLTDSVSVLYGGRYELLDLVGAGGVGTVYRARDVELDEIVALKVLRKELVRSAAVIERFRSEVKLARRVTHRNVARMFDMQADRRASRRQATPWQALWSIGGPPSDCG